MSIPIPHSAEYELQQRLLHSYVQAYCSKAGLNVFQTHLETWNIGGRVAISSSVEGPLHLRDSMNHLVGVVDTIPRIGDVGTQKGYDSIEKVTVTAYIPRAKKTIEDLASHFTINQIDHIPPIATALSLQTKPVGSAGVYQKKAQDHHFNAYHASFVGADAAPEDSHAWIFFYDKKDKLVAKLAHKRRNEITNIVGYSSCIDSFVEALLATRRKASPPPLIKKVKETPLK